jgi:hypothetical protein
MDFLMLKEQYPINPLYDLEVEDISIPLLICTLLLLSKDIHNNNIST